MTPSDADPIAAGLLLHLQSYDPADAMMILTALNAKALVAATPKNLVNGLDRSCRLFFEGVIAEIGREVKKGTVQ